MLKVIELIPTMSTGGAEAMVKDYALLLDKEKIKVSVVVLDHHYASENEKILEQNGIETLYLGAVLYGDRENLNLFQKVIRNLSRYYYFRQCVLREKPDIIHIHLRIGSYMKVLPLKRLNVRLIYTVHNVIENYFSKDPAKKDKYKEYLEADRLIRNYDMTLVALHDEMNTQLREFFHTERVVTVNNGIRMEQFHRELYDRQAVRGMLGVGEDEFLVGHVGRLHRQKNHDMILEVFEELLREKPKAKLLLVGKGERRQEILDMIQKKNLQDKVILLENRGDVPQLMSAMDVFLFPSSWEGYGNVLLEAQSMGLRCVISDQVPRGVCLTDQVIVRKLTDSPVEWVRAMLDASICGQPVGTLESHDMKNCIRQLEALYLQQEDEKLKK